MTDFIEITFFDKDGGIPSEYDILVTEIIPFHRIKSVRKLYDGDIRRVNNKYVEPNCVIEIDNILIYPQMSYGEIKNLLNVKDNR